MKKYISIALALMVVPALAQSADEAKKPEGDRKARMESRRAEIVKKYDKDGDGKLSDEEKKAMMEERKKNFEGKGDRRRGPEGEGRRAEMRKKYDKDGDGKLSDEERKAMMEDHKKAREERAKQADKKAE